jgi:uncharacterized iron-regulated protein
MKTLTFLAFFGLMTPALAAPEGLYSGLDGRNVNLEEALKSLNPGTVVVIGENHGVLTHQNQQLEILSVLRHLGFRVSVGLEFFPYLHQDAVDLYREGRLEEVDFLSLIGWGSIDYAFYRHQALFPHIASGEKTWALNAPQSLTSKVAKEGLASLTEGEKSLLPPQFSLGRDSYKTRFVEAVPHPLPPEKLDKYFAAQSIWDDTMAWRAKQFLDQHPDQILVIIVGEFHVQYGGGLPDRMKARGISSVVTFSQVNTFGIPDESLNEVLAPSPRDGVRADYLWLAPAE